MFAIRKDEKSGIGNDEQRQHEVVPDSFVKVTMCSQSTSSTNAYSIGNAIQSNFPLLFVIFQQ